MCPRCATATATMSGAVPWCPTCDWNLDAYDRKRRVAEIGPRWADRWLHRAAYRLARGQYERLVGAGLSGRATIARVVITAVSVVLMLGLLALVGLAGWLLAYDFPSLTIVPGLLLLAVAWLLRPRLGAFAETDATALDPDETPQLHALVAEVAAAIDAPVPHVVAVSDDVNAWSGAVGLRRTRVLCLGLPLWAVLTAQERLALLGHELGHFVNGDVRRRLWTQPAYTMLGSAAALIHPAGIVPAGHFLTVVAELVVRVLGIVISNVLMALQVLLVWVGRRDAQRVEYLADELAARVAGTEAAVSLMEILAAAPTVDMLVRRDARTGAGPATWRASVEESNLRGSARTALRLQLSIRDEASFFASHPPTGLRARMLRARPYQPPALTLTPTRDESLDRELATIQESFRRSIGPSARKMTPSA